MTSSKSTKRSKNRTSRAATSSSKSSLPKRPKRSAPADRDPTTTAARTGSKLAALIVLLRRPDGVTLEQMAKHTGWQNHSVRGALSGALKKKLGLNILSEKKDGARSYRIAERER